MVQLKSFWNLPWIITKISLRMQKMSSRGMIKQAPAHSWMCRGLFLIFYTDSKNRRNQNKTEFAPHGFPCGANEGKKGDKYQRREYYFRLYLIQQHAVCLSVENFRIQRGAWHAPRNPTTLHVTAATAKDHYTVIWYACRSKSVSERGSVPVA